LMKMYAPEESGSSRIQAVPWPSRGTWTVNVRSPSTLPRGCKGDTNHAEQQPVRKTRQATATCKYGDDDAAHLLGDLIALPAAFAVR
jgi:hypothetical protein